MQSLSWVGKVLFMVLNGPNDVDLEMFTILLWGHKKGVMARFDNGLNMHSAIAKWTLC